LLAFETGTDSLGEREAGNPPLHRLRPWSHLI